VKYGLAEKNRVIDTRKHGISIGHRDTTTWSATNDVTGSGPGRRAVPPRARQAFARTAISSRTTASPTRGTNKAAAIDVQGRSNR